MMEAVRTSETSVDNYFTRQYIPEDNFELHTRRRENLKSHGLSYIWVNMVLSQGMAHLSETPGSLGRCGAGSVGFTNATQHRTRAGLLCGGGTVADR
jgi:hypothetical protein